MNRFSFSGLFRSLKYCVVVAGCWICIHAAGHTAPIQNYLVQLSPEANLSEVQEAWRQIPQLAELEAEWEVLSHRIRVYRLSLSADKERLPVLLNSIESIEVIQHIKEEEPLQFRDRIPSDAQYFDQYHLPLIEAQKAWDFSTGGVTALGDTIVLSILDMGVDIDHDDLKKNIWNNRDEIPGNEMDDDENGYVDDYEGYNFVQSSGNHPKTAHGTAVSGLAGATGNNSIGIAGVNWNVKIMPLTVQTDGDVISAYEYTLEQREEYDQSNGARGAYVVATNLSAGIERAWPEDHPMWCAMYDQLLDAGILSAAAAPNIGINIDEEGDIPGTCPSPGTVIVTNTDQNDVKVSSAGYGTINVDMGAPGTDVLSLDLSNEYDEYNGASFSSPIVAGAITLLHSVDCPAFAQLARDQPREAALILKNIILRSVDLLPTLEGITVSEGRLNLNQAMLEMAEERCGAMTGPVQLMELRPNPAREYIEVLYQVPDYRSVQWRIYDVRGREVRKGTINPPAFEEKKKRFDILNLSVGLYYLEFIHPTQRIVKKFIIQ